MTEDPVVVRPETNMSAAAKVLLDRKVRILPLLLDCLEYKSSHILLECIVISFVVCLTLLVYG